MAMGMSMGMGMGMGMAAAVIQTRSGTLSLPLTLKSIPRNLAVVPVCREDSGLWVHGEFVRWQAAVSVLVSVPEEGARILRAFHLPICCWAIPVTHCNCPPQQQLLHCPREE